LAAFSINKARLLNEKPTQSHDSYVWTVYTTWQMSFDRLSPSAARLLQLCSFIHNDGISEDVFNYASQYQFPPANNTDPREELQVQWKFLSQFTETGNTWNNLRFQDITAEIMSYSLMNFDPEKRVYSMHPLVHYWCRNTVPNPEECHSCIAGIIGMGITEIPDQDIQLQTLRLLPHLDALLQGDITLVPDFRSEYARIYRHGGKYNKAARLEVVVLDQRRTCLGEDHIETLRAMANLGETYWNQGQLDEARKLQEVALEKTRHIMGETTRNP
jgi:hypothetical protein